MTTVPVDLEMTLGSKGVYWVEPERDLAMCGVDSRQVITSEDRENVRSMVKAGGGDCDVCAATCPFGIRAN